MPETNDKPVVFLAFANDLDNSARYLRNLADEKRRLRDELTTAETAGLCEVVVRSNCTVDDIFNVFQHGRYRNRVAIFHYGGHANGYELLLESATDVSGIAKAGGLAAFIALQRGIQLVFLNGCSTQRQTDALLKASVPAVISTSQAIDDKVATDFSFQFYRTLSSGASIRESFDHAQAKIQTLKEASNRALGVATDHVEPETDDWPWSLHYKDSDAAHWSLPHAAENPFFGLPPLPAKDLPESPYRHLNRFTSADSDVFFGRGRQIRELYERLVEPCAEPIILFYGQSGVGKSSILEAGLIPRLEHDHEVRCLRRTQGGLVDTLKWALTPESVNLPSAEAWLEKEASSGRPLFIFIDQVEEVFNPSMHRRNELNNFLNELTKVFEDPNIRPQGKLVLGFRKEWLAELEARLTERRLPRSKVFLQPLDRKGIIEIVSGPTGRRRLRQKYGLTIEAGVAEAIADDLSTDEDSSIAPALQILLTKMWSKATEQNYANPQFDLGLYRQLKREGILLGDFLDQQVVTFGKQSPELEQSGLLLDVIALHTTSLGTAAQHSLDHIERHYAHVQDSLSPLLQQCQDLQLLTVTTAAGSESTKYTRLVHDTLAPLVRQRFEESDRPGQRARRILDNRRVDWAQGREVPLDEADLNTVELGICGTRDLSSTERRLLEASRHLRVKLNRSRRNIRIVVGLMMILILVGAGVAEYQRRQAAIARDAAVTEAAEAERIKSFFQHHLRSKRVSQYGEIYENVDPAVSELRIRDQLVRAEIHNQLGNVFVKLEDMSKAERFQTEALKILRNAPDTDERSLEIAMVNSSVSLLRMIQGRYDEALELADQTMEMMRRLGLDEFKEPMSSTMTLRCLALNGSRDRWDKVRHRRNLRETDQTLKRLQLGLKLRTDKAPLRFRASLKVVRALMKLDYAGNPQASSLDRFCHALAGRNLMESARPDLANFPRDPTRLAIEAYDVLLPYYISKYIHGPQWLRGSVTPDPERFIVESNMTIDRLGDVFGHSNPGLLNLQMVRAQIVDDARLQDRLFVSLIDQTRKVLGNQPAYARFVYAYADFLQQQKETKNGPTREQTDDKIEFYLKDLVARLQKAVEERLRDMNDNGVKPVYRLGYAHLRLGRVLNQRAKFADSSHLRNELRKSADQEFKVAWQLFVKDGVEDFSELGGQSEFDKFREPDTK